jgi:hypothetical protein
MADKLGIYNAALRELGMDRVASLSEEVEKRYVLDDTYSDVVEECLENAQWKFAMRSAALPYSTSIVPDFGYTYAFDKPEDFVRLCAISDNENFRPSLADYRDEAGFWLADSDTIYISYVSNDTDYGMDLTRWPPSFARYVSLTLAERSCIRLTQSDTKLAKLEKDIKKARTKARSIDAQSGPEREPDGEGSWITWRRGMRGGLRRDDRGTS